MERRFRVIYTNAEGKVWVGPRLTYAEAAWFYKTFSNAIEVVKIVTMPKRPI